MDKQEKTLLFQSFIIAQRITAVARPLLLLLLAAIYAAVVHAFPDDDGDGIPDTVEHQAFLDRGDPTDALLDKDGDGWTNLEEFHLGTRINSAFFWFYPGTLNAAPNYHYKVFASDISINDAFASRVDIDGDTAIISTRDAGYIFQRSGDDWAIEQKIVPNPALGVYSLGRVVAISGETIAVKVLTGVGVVGGVDIFTRAAGVWSWQARVAPADGVTDSDFGAVLALDGDTLIVGAPDHSVSASDSGAVYVYTRSAGVWSEQGRLEPPVAFDNQDFGAFASVSGDTIVAAGRWNADGTRSASSYVFTRSAGIWTQQAQIDLPTGFAASNSSVSVSGDTLVVGSGEDSEADYRAGAAFVYTRSAGLWSLQTKLMPCDARQNAVYGWSVSIDGDTLLVGAPSTVIDIPVPPSFYPYELIGRGASYLYERNGTQWSNVARLVANDVLSQDFQGGDSFGSAVATGSTYAVIAAPNDDDAVGDTGTAYFFDYSKKITACQPHSTADSDSDGLPDWRDADIDGDGIPNYIEYIHGLNALDAADAQLDRDADGWKNVDEYRFASGISDVADSPLTIANPVQKVFIDDASSGDGAFEAVAISGNTAVVSAPNHSAFQSGEHPVYVFVRNGSLWEQQARLVSSDGVLGDAFGRSVAIDGDTIVVGADNARIDGLGDPGAAYVFVRSGTAWSEQAKLVASDAAADDEFGRSLAISGDTIVVGSPWSDHAFSNAGAAYVFVRSLGSWSEQAKLTASDAENLAWFGRAIDIDSDAVIVGAPGDGTQGAAYIYQRSGTSWSEQTKLTAGLGGAGASVALSGDTAATGTWYDREIVVYLHSGGVWNEQARLDVQVPNNPAGYGEWIALDGDRLLVGAAESTEQGDEAGSAYLFTRNGAVWSQQALFLANDGEQFDNFGRVALDGDVVVIGAPGDDDGAAAAGNAYFLDLDLDDDAVLNVNDDDDDGDGLLDSFEKLYGFNPYSAGEALLDSDSDGLNNTQEQALLTDPTAHDTDGDGYHDGYEVDFGADPLDANDFPALKVPFVPALGMLSLGALLLLSSRHARRSTNRRNTNKCRTTSGYINKVSS